MPRDSTFPPPMPWEGGAARIEEHNEWIRTMWAKWGRTDDPKPCDCGIFAEGSKRLSLCTAADRPGCHAKAKARLEAYWKAQRQKEIAAKRKWPGPEPFADAERGSCVWCGKSILRPDGLRLNLRKKRHDECLEQLLIRLRPDNMRRFIWNRDGGRCAAPGCGRVHGLHGHWDADHVLALYFAEGNPSYWAPENVVILCRDPCHKNKTREDTALIAAHRAALKLEETSPCPSTPP